MPKIATVTLLALQDELPKIASLASWGAAANNMVHSPAGKKALGLAGALGGHGAAAGAGLGALYKGYKGYSEARDQGADVTGALGSGAMGAIGGASSGALIGGLAGAGAGGAIGHLHPDADKLRTALSTGRAGALGRFGQRQMHGLTGWTPPEGLSSDAIRGGTWAADQAVKDLEAGKGPATSWFGLKKVDQAKALEQAKKVQGIEKDMQSGGLTNIPGIAKALAGKGDVSRGEALKRMFAHQWHAQDGLGKVMAAGAVAGGVAPLLTAKGREGENVGEQVGGGLGGTAGALVGSALPFYAQNKVMQAGTYVGGKLGKGVDWMRGKHRSLPDERDQSGMDGQNHPSERIPMSAGTNGVMQ